MIQFSDDRGAGPLRIRSLRDLYYVFFRHKNAAMPSVLVALGAFGALAILAPDRYRSEAKLLLRTAELRIDPTATTGSASAAQDRREM